MLYTTAVFFTIFLTICTAKSRLSLWIDERQVAIFFVGYPMEIYIISEGKVAPYLLDPQFYQNIPVIPHTVDTVNLTWEAGQDAYTYWFDELKSLNTELLYNPLLSIPSSGVVPKGPKVFQMSIPCTGKDNGIAALILGLQIFNKHGRAIRGSPVKLKLRKKCEALVTSTLCEFECQNGGRCINPGECECTQGFYGKRCELSMCDPGCENNGTCMSPEVCICPDGFSGKRCERALCKEPCQNGGRCVQYDVCWCTSGYLGRSCQFSRCKPACKSGGVCIGNNRCRCAVGYAGSLCEKKSDRPRRSNKNKNKRRKNRKKKRKKKKTKKLKSGLKKRRRERRLKKKRQRKTRKRHSLLSELMRFTNRKRKRDQRRKERERRKLEKSRKRRKLYVR